MIHDTWADRYSEACDRIDQLNDTIVALRAELAQFRPGTILHLVGASYVVVDDGTDAQPHSAVTVMRARRHPQGQRRFTANRSE